MTNGLVVMTPTTIAYSGTSASINADGSVVFSACTSLSLNGVFTSDYDNYMIMWSSTSTSGNSPLGRLRASGTDATANEYVSQYIFAGSTTVAGSRDASATNRFGISGSWSTSKSAFTLYMFGPNLAQPTAGRSVVEASQDGATIYDNAWSHSASTAYDGLTVWNIADSGLVTVFGFNQ